MSKQIKLTPFGDAVAGSSGAVVALLLVFPLDMYVFFPLLSVTSGPYLCTWNNDGDHR